MRTIYFDMDGTFVNLYGVENWLDMIINGDATPYEIAKPLFRMNDFARQIHRLQNKGYKVGIITWLAKGSNEVYNTKVTNAKIKWLRTHLTSVEFDVVNVLEYGTPKYTVANIGDVLFDDEIGNRKNWKGVAYDVENILEVLKTF